MWDRIQWVSTPWTTHLDRSLCSSTLTYSCVCTHTQAQIEQYVPRLSVIIIIVYMRAEAAVGDFFGGIQKNIIVTYDESHWYIHTCIVQRGDWLGLLHDCITSHEKFNANGQFFFSDKIHSSANVGGWEIHRSRTFRVAGRICFFPQNAMVWHGNMCEGTVHNEWRFS